jgi:two-component system response regulator AtoC
MEDPEKTGSAPALNDRPLVRAGRLLVLDGNQARIVDLPEDGSLLIGRAPEADLLLGDKSVSRQHARLLLHQGMIQIADLDSRNGVRVNGEPIAAQRVLATGDVVNIGEVTLVVYQTPRPSQAISLLDWVAFEQRLAEEVARAVEYERSLTLIAVSFSEAKIARAAVARAFAGVLRRIDVAGWSEDGVLFIIVPERGQAALGADIDRLKTAFRLLAPALRLGIARLPSDGCEASCLIAAARMAAAQASPGTHTEAGRLVTEIQIDERIVVVADPAMARIYDLLQRLASSELTVLITGENGAGKENAAYAVHAWSPRGQRPFVAINCATIPEALAESILFGHERGSFSGAVGTKEGLFEAARGGTLFLDEVGELPTAMQAKLLRALEARRILRLGSNNERPVDVRVVAATNRQLEDEVKAGRFREDLFYRLAAATVVLPPLRDRPRELFVLGQRFLAAARTTLGRGPLALAPSTLALLQRYTWPGNVRELKNTMEYLAATIEDVEFVETWQLPERITQAVEAETRSEATVAVNEEDAGAAGADDALQPPVLASAATGETGGGMYRAPRPWAEVLREFEREHMAGALQVTDGVKAQAARRLGMPLRTFMLKCRQYGL